MNFILSIKIIKEYGMSWILFRSLYAIKLLVLTRMPLAECLFESGVKIKRCPILPINIHELEHFLNQCPQEKKAQLIQLADNACDGKITGFSSLELDYGNPIDWHLNPLTGQSVSPLLKWFEIPDFNEKRGDIKVIWEASRFTHFYLFARAYLVSKNVKYYAAFSKQLQDWLRDNPYSYGANYKCGQECSLRLINALMVYSVFHQYGLTTKKDEICMKQLIHGSYKKIKSNFFYARRCVKNNHTLSELCGFIVGAWCCKNERELEKTYRLLDREIKQQFAWDGGYCQYSFVYQRFALQLMEFVHFFNNLTDKTISKESRARVINSANLLYQLQNRCGDVPNYGSNDGSLIFPLSFCGYRDFRPVVNTIFAQMQGCSIYNDGYHDEERIWFSPAKNLKRISKKQNSMLFPDSGYAVLRSQNSFAMITLHDYKTRPAQMDQLHIDLWYNEVNVFCDSGSYSYADRLGEILQKTEGHNTAKVKNLEQMGKKGPFFIYNWGKAEIHAWNESYFYGSFCSDNGYTHERKVWITENGYKIIDIVKAKSKCDILFHTPLAVNMEESIIRFISNGKSIIKMKVIGGTIQVKPAFTSLYYLQKEKILSIRIHMDSEILETEVTFIGDKSDD